MVGTAKIWLIRRSSTSRSIASASKRGMIVTSMPTAAQSIVCTLGAVW